MGVADHLVRSLAGQEDRVTTTADTIDQELVRIQQLLSDYLAHEKAQAMRVLPVELNEAANKLQVLMQELLEGMERYEVTACREWDDAYHFVRRVQPDLSARTRPAQAMSQMILR